jgi:hypothetical protein
VAKIKLLMSWDIKQGQESEYFEFVVREFAPGIIRLGLQPTEAWYTMYGSCPQIMTSGITEDMTTMQRVLASPEWGELHEKLLQYVDNFEKKIVPAAGRFQL